MTIEVDGYEGSCPQRVARMVLERHNRVWEQLDRELAEAGKGRQADEAWSWRGTPRIGPEGLLVRD
jgi:hypothetical protein